MKKIILIAVAVAFSSVAFSFGSPKTASAVKICTGTVRRNGPKIAEFFAFANGLTDAEFVGGVQELARENLSTTCSDTEIEKLIEEAKAIIARIEARREEEKLAEEARKKAEEEEKQRQEEAARKAEEEARAKEEAEKQRLLEEEAKKIAEEKLKSSLEQTSRQPNPSEITPQTTAPNTGFSQNQNNLPWIFIIGFGALSLATIATIITFLTKKRRK